MRRCETSFLKFGVRTADVLPIAVSDKFCIPSTHETNAQGLDHNVCCWRLRPPRDFYSFHRLAAPAVAKQSLISRPQGVLGLRNPF